MAIMWVVWSIKKAGTHLKREAHLSIKAKIQLEHLIIIEFGTTWLMGSVVYFVSVKEDSLSCVYKQTMGFKCSKQMHDLVLISR